jgi:hypothetical protein
MNSIDNVGGAGVLTISNLAVTVTTKQDMFYVAAVPELETNAMLLTGLGLLGFVARRRKNQQSKVTIAFR